jgi:two-component system cell cycle sensor histidine kinase/response regulator CckA
MSDTASTGGMDAAERAASAGARAVQDSAVRSGSIGLVLAVALVLVGAAVVFVLIGRDSAEPYIMALLSALAVIGVFSLFAGAAGLLRFASEDHVSDVARPIIDGSSIGKAVVDRAGRVLYANPAYLGLTGAISLDDVRGVDRVFTSDADVSEAIYRLAQAAREKRRHWEEVRSADEAGKPRWLRLRVRPLATGEKVGKGLEDAVVWTVEDITRDRERAETAFEGLQRTIDFLDHAPAGFFSVQSNGAISHMNATLAEWLGYDLAAVGTGGLSLSDLVAGEGAALFSGIEAKPGEIVTSMLDLDFKGQDGQILPVRVFHRVSYAPDGTAGASRSIVILANGPATAGTPSGHGMSAADMRFARVFNNSPLGIALVDRMGTIGRANPYFLRLAEAVSGQTENRSLFTLVAPEQREALAQAIEAAVRGHAEIAAVDANFVGAEKRSARFYVAPADPDTPDEAVLVYSIETTEQRLLQEQFAQSHKMQAIGQLAGGVAHDFNNVLQVIVGNADLLLMNHRPSDPSFNDIMQIKQNANRGASLVRQLLAFSRKQTMRPSVIQLGDVISDMTMMLKRSLGERVTSTMIHARDLWPVKADLTQIEQVILNLAVNARDAMPKGGSLTISTENVAASDLGRFAQAGAPIALPPADYVRVKVTDTGSGIPIELRQKIFEPFFSTKDVGQGTGLGLSTVYGIVKQSGGFIFVDSEIGKGTTFEIFLPRYEAEISAEQNAAQAVSSAADAVAAAKAVAEVTSTTPPAKHDEPTAEPPPSVRDDTGQGIILLVEDEMAVRAFGARALTSRGYTVLEAGSGVEALEVLHEQGGKIDLVVSDVVMPEMNGPTLLGELRKIDPTIKFIFVSGYAEDAFKNDLPEGEQFGFLPKPFTLKQLIETVKGTLGR